jgi:HAD superfamily hydrolase (TIGR01509 family)
MNAAASLRHRKSFIFDMDGTLTLAVHDFDAIRRQLGLPAAVPILEALAQLPEAEARPKWQLLDAIELELAKTAVASAGAVELLERLAELGIRVGILTRNGHENARVTLAAAGLARYFPDACIVTRDSVRPKPHPDGVLHLCRQFGHSPADAVMVGDYLHDLDCGRRAGAFTVHFAPTDPRRWPEHTDLCIRAFSDLVTLLT